MIGLIDQIIEKVLAELQGADLWIAICLVVIGVICCLIIDKARITAKQTLSAQIAVSLVLLAMAGIAIWINHAVFQRERPFSQSVTGIVIMRIMGDDVANSLQGDLIETLNGQLHKEATNLPIEVHAGRETIDNSNGLLAAHEHARMVGKRLKAQLVIWGRRGIEKRFYPRITVVTSPEEWSAERDRTLQTLSEVTLPEEVVDEPFYLVHFAAGFSRFLEHRFKEALPEFEAALQHSKGESREIADLEFFTAFCHQALGEGQKDMSTELLRAIPLLTKAAGFYAKSNRQSWAKAQNNLGRIYAQLPTTDQLANWQKAVAAFQAAAEVYSEVGSRPDWAVTEMNLGNALSLPVGKGPMDLQGAITAYDAALTVFSEKDYPPQWARIQTNLGIIYAQLPTANPTDNLKKAMGAFAAALRILTEADFPQDWALGQYQIGMVYSNLSTEETGLQQAIAAFERALRVFSETSFPFYWASTQDALGTAYGRLAMTKPVPNLQNAITAFEAALRVKTEKEFPLDWADIQQNLGNVYQEMVAEGQTAEIPAAIGAYEAALRIHTQNNSPIQWATIQYSLGRVYHVIAGPNRFENLKKAKDYYNAALSVVTENSSPQIYHGATQGLSNVEDQLRILTPENL